LSNDQNTSLPLDPRSVSLVAPADALDVIRDIDGDIIGFMVPDEGEWSVDEDTGVVTFVPDANLVGDPKPINYTVRETNGDVSNKATLSIQYINDSAVPIAVDDGTIRITEYGPTVIDVLSNDTFGSDDNFGEANIPNEIIIITQPKHGTVSLDDGGTPNDPTDDVFIYTPEANIAHVQDSFEYTITDSNGDTSTAEVLLDVNCASTQKSDSGSALGVISMLMMMFMTTMAGLYYARREDEREDERGEA